MGVNIMDVRREDMRAGLHRANGVLNWRGVPENHPVRESLNQFREIVADLDRCFQDASREQINTLNATHDSVASSMPALLRKQSEDELVAREAEILSALLEAAKLHSQVWAALTSKIEGCYVGLLARASARGPGNPGATTRRRKSDPNPAQWSIDADPIRDRRARKA
jgi:hypothetical protein